MGFLIRIIHNQGTVWQDLTRFYLENEKTIERSLELDVRSNDKASELDAALVIFLETANVILQGLVALSYVRPVLGSTFNLVTNFISHHPVVAIFTFQGVISLDLTRRDNNRKVVAVKPQMQNMMCAIFQCVVCICPRKYLFTFCTPDFEKSDIFMWRKRKSNHVYSA